MNPFLFIYVLPFGLWLLPVLVHVLYPLCIWLVTPSFSSSILFTPQILPSFWPFSP